MNRIQLVQVLKILFPSALQGSGYTLAVDGSGNAAIAMWLDATDAQPTVAQLTAQLATMQLQQAQKVQMVSIAQASDAAQTTGFSSSALGSAYTYPSGLQDQANLTSCIVASLIPGNPTGWTVYFWCTSSAGVSTFLPHTAAQIQKVGQDALSAIMTQKSKQLTLTQQILAATTISAVQAVVWG
ncbi:MAG TPA: hypothetical protein DIT28_01340 [Oxalobacteraceae bacterium]|nr:hypothetical protein [Oxalobacteraceae bacterium]